MFIFFEDLHFFGEVFVDLVPKVAQTFQKLPQTLGGFGFRLMGPSLEGPNRALYGLIRALLGPYLGSYFGLYFPFVGSCFTLDAHM